MALTREAGQDAIAGLSSGDELKSGWSKWANLNLDDQHIDQSHIKLGHFQTALKRIVPR